MAKNGFNIKELVKKGGSGNAEPMGPGPGANKAPAPKKKKRASSGMGDVLPPKPTTPPPPTMAYGGM